MAPPRSAPPGFLQRHPVALVTAGALLLQAAVQGLVARSVSTDLWWQTEWVRLPVRLRHPTAAYASRLPQPDWQAWVPSAATAVLVTAALVGLGLLLARAGRGPWLLVVAALPLIPVELAPGTWAPPLINQAAYALVWPAGSTAPDPTWAWMSAAMTALLVALPGTALAAASLRRPRTAGRWVLGRLALPAVAAALTIAWWVAGDVPVDAWTVAWYAVLALTGALAVTGALRARWAYPFLLALPALAGGLVRWTSDVDGGTSVQVDWATRTLSFVAVAGALWAVGQPAFAHAVRTLFSRWYAAVVADVAVRNAQRNERAERALLAEQANAEPAEDWDDDLVSPGPSPAGRARAAGRHRA